MSEPHRLSAPAVHSPLARPSSRSPTQTATTLEDTFPSHVEAYSDARPPAASGASPSVAAPTPVARSANGCVGERRRKARGGRREGHMTAEQVQGKRCWICYDDDDPTDPIAKKHGSWVHPCHCSLVAHEDCLLTWITTHQLTHPVPSHLPATTSRLSSPVSCPQCGHPYQLVQPSSPTLSALHYLKRRYDFLLGYFGFAGILLGGAASLGLYGLWAARCFLGPSRFARWTLPDPTSQRGGMGVVRLMQLSLVGPTLVLGRTRLLDSLLPFLPLSLVLSSVPPPSEIDVPAAKDMEMEWVFPPSPTLTICLLPWARLGWSWAWSHVARRVILRERLKLGMSSDPPPRSGGPAGQGQQQNEINLDFALDDDIAAPQAAPAAQGAAGDGQAPQPPVGAQAVDHALSLSASTLRKLLRMALGALLFPLAASFAGTVLLHLARRSPLLQKLLGVRLYKLGLPGAKGADPVASLAGWWGLWNVARTYSTPIWKRALSRSGDGLPDQIPLGATTAGDYLVVGAARSGGKAGEDPVWWRNAVGGAIVVVAKDVVNLVEKVLELRKIGTRRVKGYGFEIGCEDAEGEEEGEMSG